MSALPPFSESHLREVIARAQCWADALRELGYAPKGANNRTVKRWISRWGISTAHFDPNVGRKRAGATRRPSLESVMVEHSTYARGKLKARLLREGLKSSVCELCGQGEEWRGRRMSMILDHINGQPDDHRLANLRMLCPNCAATLDTHCGRNLPRERTCPTCHSVFAPITLHNRYCSLKCWGVEAGRQHRGVPHPESRKVARPPEAQLRYEIRETSMAAVGRKYGVSDNAVRKWLRSYEREREREGERTEVAAPPGHASTTTPCAGG